MSIVLQFLAKSLLSMVAKLATEELFTFLVLHLVKLGVKSTATTWDDEVFARVEKVLDKPSAT